MSRTSYSRHSGAHASSRFQNMVTHTHTLYFFISYPQGFGGRPCNCSTLVITVVGRFQGHTQFGKLKLLVWVVVGKNQIGIGFDFWNQF
jgi:hypothetical protein